MDLNKVNAELHRKLRETALQLNIHRNRYTNECNTRLHYELENRQLRSEIKRLKEQLKCVTPANTGTELIRIGNYEWARRCRHAPQQLRLF